MSLHKAGVDWVLDDGDFAARRYSRLHALRFGEGVTVPGSPSPQVVAAPWSSHQAIDPEAAFIAALSACHMLWFLDLAAQGGFVVTSYSDDAEGTLGRIGPGRMAMTRVVLRPAIVFGGDKAPTTPEIEALHHAAHQRCFIANSITTEVVVEAGAG